MTANTCRRSPICLSLAAALALVSATAAAAQGPLAPREASGEEELWTARTQDARGAWPGDAAADDVTATALMTLTLAVDYSSSPKDTFTAVLDSAHRASIRRGLGFVLANWVPALQAIEDGIDAERAVVAHATVLLLLSELRVLRAEIEVHAAPIDAELAALLLAAQRADGSFGTPRATGWALYALVAAREAGWAVDPEALLRGRRALAASVTTEGVAAEALDPTAVALRCLIGFMVAEPDAEDGTPWRGDVVGIEALARLVQVEGVFERFDPEERFLVSLAAYNAGGKTWAVATKALRFVVSARLEEREPRSTGLFRAEGRCGTTRATAFGVLTTMLYFRYLRLIGGR